MRDQPDGRRRGAGRAPDAAAMIAMAEAALAEIPRPFREAIDGIAIRIEEFPDTETEREMGLDSPFDLLGLYRGVSLAEKSGFDPPRGPDEILLYRRPILEYWCETGETLEGVVRHVLIHEIGHHFGLSDADMEAIEGAAEGGAEGAGI